MRTSNKILRLEARILSRYHGMASEDPGDAEEVLIFDESG